MFWLLRWLFRSESFQDCFSGNISADEHTSSVSQNWGTLTTLMDWLCYVACYAELSLWACHQRRPFVCLSSARRKTREQVWHKSRLTFQRWRHVISRSQCWYVDMSWFLCVLSKQTVVFVKYMWLDGNGFMSLCPVWAQECCRLSPPHFLAKCRKRWLIQDSFVLQCFVLFAFSGLCLVSVLSVFLICLLSCTLMAPFSLIVLMCR